jgi:hypothetical protein
MDRIFLAWSDVMRLLRQWSGRVAHASKKEIGLGSQGKLDATGVRKVLPDGVLPDNMVLSNRDKASYSGERGLDSRQIQTEQFHDHVGARRNLEDEDNPHNSSHALQGASELDPEYQERVRTRAYELWDREGRLEGRDELHWLMAEQELQKR